ncbi:MAG: type II toxin-antitoxin system VapC family toxin [Candidatus Electrothrix sp. AR1]|nr:type II toxin-antitoxin system VapC family toxin [Candidatus Electrothrix sp. AR1]
MKKERYVIDTNGLISFFAEVFCDAPNFDRTPAISQKTRNTVQEAVSSLESNVLLSVPSIVFIEIYEKWLRSEEFTRKFFYEIYTPLKQSPNVEIRAIDQEVLENLLIVDGCLAKHDLHDKIVVAAAITLECPIITFDERIIEFVENGTKKIPKVIN